MSPRVARVRSGRRIAPWGDPVGEVRILGIPLAERQERIARDAGLGWAGEVEEVGADPGILYWDAEVDVSLPALRRFLKGGGGRLGLVDRPALSQTALDPEPAGPTWEGEPSRLYGLRWGEERPQVLPPSGFGGRMKLPMGAEIPWFLSEYTAVTVRHWTQVLRANLLAAPVALWQDLVLSPWNIAWTWLRSPLRAGPGRTARVGRDCDIHPTARLEGCLLGDRVRVGAFSVLRGCILGDDAIIEDHVTARGSVVEAGGHLANYSMFNLSVLGAGSSVGHIGAQASILGRGSFVATFAVLQDLNFGGNVRVLTEEGLVDSGTPFLGAAIGHRVRVASTLVLPPGRQVPNDVELHADPEFRPTVVPQDLAPGRYLVRNRQVIPLVPPR